MKYAEELPYWDTTVKLENSQAEVMGLLNRFGASAVMFAQGQTPESGFAWLVRFQYLGRAYRFVFTPRPCRLPSKVYSISKKSVTGAERARLQMGRRAVYFVKAILDAAEENPDALFGFVELESGGRVVTAAELDVSGLVQAMPAIEIYPRLGDGN